MRLILRKFSKYQPWFDEEQKILYFKGKMYVEELIYLRLLLKLSKTEVNDIRINY